MIIYRFPSLGSGKKWEEIHQNRDRCFFGFVFVFLQEVSESMTIWVSLSTKIFFHVSLTSVTFKMGKK